MVMTWTPHSKYMECPVTPTQKWVKWTVFIINQYMDAFL